MATQETGIGHDAGGKLNPAQLDAEMKAGNAGRRREWMSEITKKDRAANTPVEQTVEPAVKPAGLLEKLGRLFRR